MKWDYLIVGAGLTGATCSRLLAEQGKSCLVVDKRSHVGGNCYDELDDHGILTHVYGPHHFRTDHQNVLDFLIRFTDWTLSEYKARSLANGKFYHFPISLLTYEQLMAKEATREEMIWHINSVRSNYLAPENSEELIISQVGHRLFEMFYAGYTRKMWGRPARELAPSVCGRIPVYFERDDRYSRQRFQGVPRDGYTEMFRKMLAHPKIKVLLDCDFQHAKNAFRYSHLIYTGPIDNYFEHRLGRLPYRSLWFHRSERMEGLQQPACQISYPGLDVPYTRSIEIKHITKQDTPYTVVIREYPEEYTGHNEPYYPIPAPDTRALYRQYEDLAQAEKNVSFAGRLGSYQYLNMDQAVLGAFGLVEKLEGVG